MWGKSGACGSGLLDAKEERSKRHETDCCEEPKNPASITRVRKAKRRTRTRTRERKKERES